MLDDMYAFIGYCKDVRNCTVQTRSRKIIAIRQVWKYLKTKAHLIDNNIVEELESSKLPQKIPECLDLEDSMRLLIKSEGSARNYCILTLFLNCTLRLAELVSLNVDQIDSDALTVVGKGNKERNLFLTPSVKRAVYDWL